MSNVAALLLRSVPLVGFIAFRFFLISLADVAELVDAHASGACIRKDVRVRFSPSAPFDSALRGLAHGPRPPLRTRAILDT